MKLLPLSFLLVSIVFIAGCTSGTQTTTTTEGQQIKSGSETELLDTAITVYFDREKEYTYDLIKGESIHITIGFKEGEGVDLDIERGTDVVYSENDILNKDFKWTVPEDGRYTFVFWASGDRSRADVRLAK